MTQRIHKYLLRPPSGEETFSFIDVPEGAKLIHVYAQKEEAYVWAIIEDGKPMVKRKLAIMATGRPLPELDNEEALYVGTLHMNFFMMPLVMHVFDVKPAVSVVSQRTEGTTET